MNRARKEFSLPTGCRLRWRSIFSALPTQAIAPHEMSVCFSRARKHSRSRVHWDTRGERTKIEQRAALGNQYQQSYRRSSANLTNRILRLLSMTMNHIKSRISKLLSSSLYIEMHVYPFSCHVYMYIFEHIFKYHSIFYLSFNNKNNLHVYVLLFLRNSML